MEHSLAGILWRMAGILALVVANGIFVAAEFSIVTVRRTRVDQLVSEGRSRAHAVRRAVSEPDRYIAATQLGITMASLGRGWIGEPALASVIQPVFASLPSPLAITTAAGRSPDLRHLISMNFSAPRSAPKPASVTT
jgi:putative hemolysin